MLKKSGSAANLSFGSIIKIGILIAALAGVLIAIDKFDIGKDISSVIALSVLMNALAKTLKIASKCSALSTGAIVGMLAIASITTVMVGILGHFNVFDRVSFSGIAALSVLLNALAAAALTVSKIGVLPPKAATNVASLMAVITIVSAAIVGLAGIVGSPQEQTNLLITVFITLR